MVTTVRSRQHVRDNRVERPARRSEGQGFYSNGRLPVCALDAVIPIEGTARPLRASSLGRMAAKFGVVVIALLLAGCGGPSTAAGIAPTSFDSPAASACERSTYASQRQMVAAFSSTAAAVVHWQETRAGPTGPQRAWDFSSSPNDVIYVCYFDGFFPKAPPLPLNGTPLPSFDRIIVLVAPGMDELDSAGYQQQVSIVRP